MLELAALKDIRPFVATPSHAGTMSSNYVRSLLGLVNLAWTHGFAMQTRFLDGDSLITRARNRLVAEFMADARWTHLFWIDADIGFEPEAALRLLLAGRDVVAGIYPHKTDGWPEAGLDAPTGFMLIARSVFERMATAFPQLRYAPDRHADPADRARAAFHYRFFDVLAEPGNGAYLAEDFAFCRRWQSIGGKVWIDARSHLSHQGLRTYTGHFGQALAARGGPPA